MRMTQIQVEEKVYLTYPITKRERTCAMYKAKIEAKREALRNRLNDQQRKNGLCEIFCEYQSQVWQKSLS